MELIEFIEKIQDYVMFDRKNKTPEEMKYYRLSLDMLSKAIDHAKKLENREIPEYAADVFEYADNMNEFLRLKMKEMMETQRKLVEQNEQLTRQLNYSNPYAKFVN